MRLKEGRDHHVYEVEDMHLEPGLERRMGALGLTKGTRVEILNNQKEGAVIVKFRGTRFALGRKIGEHVRPGTVIALVGDLGVGKTVFTQGVAAGLGIREPVNSPTFTIMQIYDGGRLPFYHFDVYRIGDIEEMEEIGYEDCFYGEGVCLVEWADLIQELLPEETCRITIEKDMEKGMDYRRITVEGLKVELDGERA